MDPSPTPRTKLVIDFDEGEDEKYVGEWKNDQKHEDPGSPLCIVKLTTEYIGLLTANGLSRDDSPMLPALNKDTGKLAFPAATASYDDVQRVKKIVLRKLGLDPDAFGLHSPKVGAIYALRDAGVKWEDIQIKAGWKKGSPMPERYAQKAVQLLMALDNKL